VANRIVDPAASPFTTVVTGGGESAAAGGVARRIASAAAALRRSTGRRFAVALREVALTVHLLWGDGRRLRVCPWG
jgi:hypothetical protein